MPATRTRTSWQVTISHTSGRSDTIEVHSFASLKAILHAAILLASISGLSTTRVDP